MRQVWFDFRLFSAEAAGPGLGVWHLAGIPLIFGATQLFGS
jgi:hypothetical protein